MAFRTTRADPRTQGFNSTPRREISYELAMKLPRSERVDAREGLLLGSWRGPSRLLCAAALLHFVLAVALYEVGRRAAFPNVIDEHGVVTAVAPDAADFREQAALLSGALRSGEVRYWLGSDYSFHVKLYSVCYALFGPLIGYNVLAAESLNLMLYLACLALVFSLGREVSSHRAGLIAAGAVALWPSFVLHSTQLLKDPLFVPLFLGLVLILARLLTRTYTLAKVLPMGAAGAAVIVALCLTRSNWRWLLVAIVLVGALMLAIRQFKERQVLVANFACVLLLLAAVVSLPYVMPNALKLGLENDRPKAVDDSSRLRLAPTEGSRRGHIWTRASAQVGDLRRGLAASSPDSGSDIGAEVRIEDASDLVTYLPRAAAIGFFAPFPNMWLTAGKHSGLVGRRLAGVESLAIYAVEALAFLGLWQGRRRLGVWLLASVAAMGITTLGLVLVNVGALYRMRNAFLALLIIVAAGAVAGMIQGDGRRRSDAMR